jgi:hypothetical protein
MIVLDPKNVDLADLLSLIRDINDQLGDLKDATDQLGADTTWLMARKPARKGKGKRKHGGGHHHGHGGDGYREGVVHAVQAVLADLDARSSLIPVNDSDDEYDERCLCCLLRKNGYPHLAETFSEVTP